MKRPLAPPYAPETRERVPAALGCHRDCCWSPYGHSTVRDHLAPWHKDACHCHEPRTLGPQECETPECALFIGHDGDHYPTKENHDD